MAIDSTAKRQSFFSHGGRFWKGTAIVPDGSIDAPDRLHYVTFYSGNPVSAIVVSPATANVYVVGWERLPEN